MKQVVAKHPRAILAIVLASTLMVAMDVSVVITALPQIHSQFGFSPVTLSWVSNAYSVVFGGLMLLGARSGDLLGRRRMFMVGLTVFTLASLFVGIAQSALWLIVARAVQGLGGAILSPSTLALLTANFREGAERTRVLALYGTVVAIAGSIGLILGGILTSLISWRFAFFINVPIGLIVLLVTRTYIPETPRHSGRLDIPGTLTSVVGMIALIYGIVHAADAGWSDPITLITVIGGVALLGLFVLIESRVKSPIMPLSLFKSRTRSGSYLSRTLYLGVMISFWFFLTQYLQVVKGLSPIVTGLAFLPLTASNFIAAFYILPKLGRRINNAKVVVAGIAITVVGMLWLSQLTTTGSYFWQIALPFILLGIGQGLSQGPLTAEGLAGVKDKNAGAASGVTYVASQLGASLGLAILVTVFATVSTGMLSGNALLTHRINSSMIAATVLLTLSLIVAVFMIMRRKNNKPIED